MRSSLPCSSSLPIFLLAFFATHSLLQFVVVRGDAFEDLWNQYMQQSDTKQQQQQQYESTVSRRERNLDHWDVPTAAAYLGLHPETLKPLPRFASTESSASSSVENNLIADEYIGHDAAILFYAQWDRNSHAVAPTWDAIATHLHAGSISSNIIMALFDCEKNTKHVELCTAAGITAYPTIMYVGSGTFHDTDWLSRVVVGKDKSAGPYGATTLRRTVKFQGNWQYGDQILDWIIIMKGLSSWHTIAESGPLRGLRNGLFRFLTGGGSKSSRRSSLKKRGAEAGGGGSLPVGVPPHFQSELRSGSGGGGGSGSGASLESAKKIKNLEKELNATMKEKELYELAATHSNLLLEGLLFPKNKHNTNTSTDSSSQQHQHIDPFTILTNSDGWYRNATTVLPIKTTTTTNDNNKHQHHPSILRSCVLELAIDYCNRLTTRSTTAYLDVLNAIPESDPFPTLDEIEQYLLEDVKSHEPYCGLLESCMVSNFEKEEECRPQSCPFVNEAACTYAESCLEPEIQNEYGVALGLIEKGETVLDKVWESSTSSSEGGSNSGIDNSGTASGKTSEGATTTGSSSSSVGGWGIP
ncbi:hypothetical protein ACHAXH_003495, partial [Discostella pseudostelligera]